MLETVATMHLLQDDRIQMVSNPRQRGDKVASTIRVLRGQFFFALLWRVCFSALRPTEPSLRPQVFLQNSASTTTFHLLTLVSDLTGQGRSRIWRLEIVQSLVHIFFPSPSCSRPRFPLIFLLSYSTFYPDLGCRRENSASVPDRSYR